MMKNSNVEVTTVSGKILPRIKCRFISNQYYEIGVDCFLMQDNKWHRKNNGKIEFDYELNTYVLVESSSMINGIVAIGDKGSEFKVGYFSANPSKNVHVSTSEYGTISCLNEDIPKIAGYEESISSGIFYKGLAKSDLNKKAIGSRYSFNLEYSSAPKIKIFNGSYLENYTPKTNVSSKFFKETGSTSFGFEFETENGFIPERHLFRNGIIPVRDGSLRHDNIEPYEYVTIPLRGEKGITTLIDTVELLKKHTTIGHKCALHLHLGGFTPTKEIVVSMHKLMIRIQDEMFQMFPPNYKFTSQNNFKSKDYCSPIKGLKGSKDETIDDKFTRILHHFAGGPVTFRGFGAENHPKDRANSRKWDIAERYFICNFVPILWGPTGTFEFRVHPPTHNIDKVINWLFICNAILKFADKYQREIPLDKYNLKPVNLDYILKDVYSPELASILSKYIEEKKSLCEKMSLKMNDQIGDYELKTDLTPVLNSIL